MTNKSKTYIVLLLVIIGFVFLGIGCTGKNNGGSSPASNISSGGAPVQETTATEAPQGTAGAETQSLSVKGSDTILPLAQAEAEEFMNESTGKSVSVTGGGSGVGIAAFVDGQIDIATASREMNTNETEAAKKNGINPVKTTIAYDGITVVVNPANPVSNLTFAQVRGIYNGSISNWKEVGGEDKKIIVIARDSTSGTYADFKKDVLLGDEYRPDVLTQSGTGPIVIEVSQNPDAIGYIGFAYLDNSTKALSLDKGNGYVAPTAESILNGAYPLSRALLFYTNGEPSGLTKEFVDFVLSEKGQIVVSKVGYVPLKK
jgi:phosphate transport system substrate-binding protein